MIQRFEQVKMTAKVIRFDKIESPCWSASHLLEMHGAMNRDAIRQETDPRDVVINLSLHEFNLLVKSIKGK